VLGFGNGHYRGERADALRDASWSDGEFDVVRREALASETLRRTIDRDGVRIYPVA
jgi:hypothetical protein